MNEKDDKFSFVREQIKEKPYSKKRLAKEALIFLCLGIIFGAAAAVTNHLIAESYAQKEEEAVSQPVEFTIPSDELEPSPAPEIPENPVAVENAEIPPEDLVTSDDVQSMIDALGPEEYQNLTKKVFAIGKEANSSIVEVTAITSDMDFLNMPYETEGITSGLILGDNGLKKLVLTRYDVIRYAQKIQVAFCDGAEYEAEVVGFDTTTDLAVVAVELSSLSESTVNAITDASLGNSRLLEQGQVVLALGEPTGEVYSILCGSITSTGAEMKLDDGNYDAFTTDMICNAGSSGFLINLKGEVIGLYSDSLSMRTDAGVLSAVSISELKTLIEKMSNGKSIAYLGLQMTTITDDLAEANQIPAGAYITGIELGSPAFDAGLRVGDVVVKIGTADVSKVGDVTAYLLNCDQGDSVTVKVERLGGTEYKELSCTAVLK